MLCKLNVTLIVNVETIILPDELELFLLRSILISFDGMPLKVSMSRGVSQKIS